MSIKKDPSEFVKYSEGVATITLSRPFMLAGTKVSALSMREPLVRDQLAMDAASGTAASKETGMFANLCDITPTDLEALPLRDYLRVQAAYQGFVD